MRYAKSVEELIGKTPLLELSNYEKKHGLKARVLAKVEGLNPSGSVKDRAALAMIRTAEEEGKLKPGSVIIEPTSGNTGIGLASLAAAKGYRLILVMPETMSLERRKLLKGYGAELVLTEGARGMAGAIERAEELAKEIPGSFLPGQFDNEANPRIHEQDDRTGDLGGHRRQGGCTGSRSGNRRNADRNGRFLKQKNPEVKVVAVEPESSPVLSGGNRVPI